METSIRYRRVVAVAGVALMLAWPMRQVARGYDSDASEEPGGSLFAVEFSPELGLLGIAFGQGSWLRGTPIYADYAVSLFSDSEASGLYGGVGLTLRLLPHWPFAPFCGVGFRYNYPFAEETADDGLYYYSDEPGDMPLEDLVRPRTGAYWAAHGDAGLRMDLGGSPWFLEAVGRYTFVSGIRDEGYWVCVVGVGQGL